MIEPLADALAHTIAVRDAILDGEIIVMRDKQPDFYALMLRRGTPEYAAFDLLWLNGNDLRPLPYKERKRRLRKLLAGHVAIGYEENHAEPDLFEAAQRMDLKGIIAKGTTEPYEVGTEWVKVKHPHYSQKEGRRDLFHEPVKWFSERARVAAAC